MAEIKFFGKRIAATLFFSIIFAISTCYMLWCRICLFPFAVHGHSVSMYTPTFGLSTEACLGISEVVAIGLGLLISSIILDMLFGIFKMIVESERWQPHRLGILWMGVYLTIVWFLALLLNCGPG